MTFLEICTDVYDRMGVTGNTDLVKRLVNEAVQVVATRAKLGLLEQSWAVTFSATGVTALSAEVMDVLSVLNDANVPLDEKDRDAFEDFYRGDVTAGSKPTVFCLSGTSKTDGAIQISTWPVITAATGFVRGLRRVKVMTADADIPEVPSELHWQIVDEAVARMREWEESEVGLAGAQRGAGLAGAANAAMGEDRIKKKT